MSAPKNARTHNHLPGGGACVVGRRHGAGARTPFSKRAAALTVLAVEQRSQMRRLRDRSVTGPALDAVIRAHAVTCAELAKMDAARRALLTAPGAEA